MKNGFFSYFLLLDKSNLSEKMVGRTTTGLERYSYAKYFVFTLSALLATFIFQDKIAPK